MRKDRKKIHQKIVKQMRMLNKNWAEDEYLGLNRFRIDMRYEDYEAFDDKSGGILYLVIKLTDTWTNNTACFDCNSYEFLHKTYKYANDFFIRCSSGCSGHFPHLHYLQYDVHEVIPYEGRSSEIDSSKFEDGVVDTYSWI